MYYFIRVFLITILIAPKILLSAADSETVLSGREDTVNDKIHLIKEIPSSSVKDQYKSGTCWSFSTISLIETELIRAAKGEFDLSEMFIVNYNYKRKAEKYVRMHGKMNFSAGGEANDVMDIIKIYGIVPDAAYPGLKASGDRHNHGEMDRALQKYVNSIVSEHKEISSDWMDGYSHILETYLGKIPDFFTYEGIDYTPETFALSLGLNPANYIMITSFTHHPYYEPFILEIPDNWSWNESYNVPLDVLESIVDTAVMRGYSVAWATDISEDGFNFLKKGMALAPSVIYASDSLRGSAKWKKKTHEEKENCIFSLDEPVEELNVTPELRQIAYETYTTTDDHGMLILGMATDRNGRRFYYVKNSWGTDNPYKGYMFVSKPYFRYKTISIMLNKEALTSEIRSLLSL